MGFLKHFPIKCNGLGPKYIPIFLEDKRVKAIRSRGFERFKVLKGCDDLTIPKRCPSQVNAYSKRVMIINSATTFILDGSVLASVIEFFEKLQG